MPDNLIVSVILAIIALSVIALVVNRILAFLKGSLTININQTSFQPGDVIQGSVDLKAKKTIEANVLCICLIGKQETEEFRDGKRHTRTREIFRDEVRISDRPEYLAGTEESYAFEISVPDMSRPDFLDSSVGQLLSSAMRLMSDRRTKVNWHLEARLDAKGADLTDSKKLYINMPGSF